MKILLKQTGDGPALLLPPDMLAACGIRDEAFVELCGEQLIVSSPDAPRPADDEDEEALAHWASLPEVPGTPETRHDVESLVLREEPTTEPIPRDKPGA